MCTVCRDPRAAEILERRREGVSYRTLERDFRIHKATLHSHFKECIGLRRSVTDEARARNRMRRTILDGNIQEALVSAQARLLKAEEGGNMEFILKAQSAVTKLLSLKSQGIPRTHTETQLTLKQTLPSVVSNAVIFPADTEPDFAKKFGGIREGTLTGF